MVYDCIIVGSGPTGIYSAVEFIKKGNNTKVLLIEKGKDIYHRSKPIQQGSKTIDFKKLPRGYSITTGFGGSGAYSDGKFNITSEFGGWLTDYLSVGDVTDLINYVDDINIQHGATQIITDPSNPKVKEIEKRGYAVGLKLLKARLRHLGTDENLKILTSIFDYLKQHIEMLFDTSVADLIIEDKIVKGVITSTGERYLAKKVVLAVGREGAKWLSGICEKYHISMSNNQVDVGVRVETSNIIMEEINENLYEGKFVYLTSVGTSVRTFCSNPSGHVVLEDYDDLKLVNGHAYANSKLGSTNTNFALLVSHKFSEPFNKPNDYAFNIGKLANELSVGSVIVQKYGDLLKGRRTTYKRLDEGFITPTLKEAVPGDLSLVLPYKTLKSIIEMIEALNFVTPGIATEHTLLYGVETKFYSARPTVNNSFELVDIKNLYVGGDGAGITRSLAQAGANGVYIARQILKDLDHE
ncbi:MAG: FAD-dependent oxidoreductase [Bacillales bacterium]|jgi:uncharacterized FAD-dependent dehydrogenase|nr:FAD-dependent oxidoreductase [Bacillales bacterium]